MLSRSLLVRYGCCVSVTPQCPLPNESTIPMAYCCCTCIHEIIFTSPQTRLFVSASDEYPLHNKRKVFVRGRIPSPNHEASIRPLDKYPLQNMGQVYVPWTNTLSRKWGKYSSLGRVPSPKHGASIHPMDEYPLQHMGQVFVLWTNTPTRNLGQDLARGRIVPIRRMDLSGIRQIYSYSCGVWKIGTKDQSGFCCKREN